MLQVVGDQSGYRAKSSNEIETEYFEKERGGESRKNRNSDHLFRFLAIGNQSCMPKFRLNCLKSTAAMDRYARGRDFTTPELRDLFQTYSSNGEMQLVHFHKFLMEVQQEPGVSEVDAKMRMEARIRPSGGPMSSPPTFNERNFVDYLFDTQYNLAINTTVHHDMTCPLSHYFIFTGHNSYLTGNQLSSTCSETPIVEALLRGVRAIELDMWPSQSKDDILVLHGRTWTAPVEFQKCIRAIKDNAFKKSEYPVVVTLEDHLPPELQAKAAKVMLETFGDALYYPAHLETMREFPSPDSLKQNIIISTKPPKDYLTSKDLQAFETERQASEKAEVRKDSVEILGCQDILADHEAESLHDENKAPEYKKIITIRAGKAKGKSLVNALRSTEEYAKRISLSEPQFAKIAASHPADIVRFTRRNFLRIYPTGLRIDSSNYNPIRAWSHGAQMAALNMQGYGKHLRATQGFFRANGGCGYVKKPTFLFPRYSETCPNTYDPNQGPVKQTLKVKLCIVRGWFENFGRRVFGMSCLSHLHAKIRIVGVKADKMKKETKTSSKIWMPQWEEQFEFWLRVPELAVLMIMIHEHDRAGKDEFAGQICLPISELKTGFRVIPLCNREGEELQQVRLLLRLNC